MKITFFPSIIKSNQTAKHKFNINSFSKNPINFEGNNLEKDIFEHQHISQNSDTKTSTSEVDLDKIKAEIERLKQEIAYLEDLDRYKKYQEDKKLKNKWRILHNYLDITENPFKSISSCMLDDSENSQQQLRYILSRLSEIPYGDTAFKQEISEKLVEFTKTYFLQCKKKQENPTSQGLDEYIKKRSKQEIEKIKLNKEDARIETHIETFKNQLKSLEKKYRLYLDSAFDGISPEAKKVIEQGRYNLSSYAGLKIDIMHDDIKKVIELFPEIRIFYNHLIDITSPVTQQAIEDYRAGKLTSASDLAKKYGINVKIFQAACSSLQKQENGNSKQTLIDLRDEHIQQAIKNILLTHPKKSKYYLDGFGTGKNITYSIPVKYLAGLGFGTEKALITLIETKRIKGENIETENGSEYHVIVNNAKILKDNPTAKILFQLRDKTPHIYSSKDLKKELHLTQKEFEQALLDEELEIIPEYLTPHDREQRYINISTPKNKNFYLKRKIELEIKKEVLQKEKEARKIEKIEKFNYNQRIQGIRSKLAWMFMPMTKVISSKIAKQDGYLCSLLAKPDDPEAELTNHEITKIKSYYKEVWLTAGTEEQKAAYKKANEILRTFKEQGLEAVDKEYLPIFEMYGFTLN